MKYESIEITKNKNTNFEIVLPGTDRHSKLCASLNPAPFNDEIIIGVKDKNGLYDQDLVLVRRNLKTKKYEVIVWADVNNDDYTNIFEIDRRVSTEEQPPQITQDTDNAESNDCDNQETT